MILLSMPCLPRISVIIFSNSNRLVALLNTFVVFALGYLARPLGGIVFGHLGDKFGRKSAFSLSVFIMATATLLMGCLPDYQAIGITAPLSLIGLRLLQGFSVGGEIPGAAIFIFEHVPLNKRGFSIGLVFMCITLGNSLGALVGLFLTFFLSQEQMLAWGWRIPFIIGFLLGIISYVIRKRAFETPIFLTMLEKKGLQEKPLSTLLQSSRKELLRAFLLTAVSSSTISLFLYLPTYLSTVLHTKVTHAYLVNLITF
ncbi:MFS transporter [Legionella tunisiensis]|uniref:MFS transporter n=1 Tax=Legionella tunisiensis TaxID=1034944 RepID=UPI000310B582|nr:MFS transporter [Legionella tunisiensis]